MTGSVATILDYVSLDFLQGIQDSLGGAAGLSIVFLSPEGVPVTQETNPCSLCAFISSNEKGAEVCRDCKRSRLTKGECSDKLIMGVCPVSGLSVLTFPLFSKGEYLGCFMVKQIRVDAINYEWIKKITAQAGLSFETARELVQNSAFVENHEKERVIKLIHSFIEELNKHIEMQDDLKEKVKNLEVSAAGFNRSMASFHEFIDFAGAAVYIADHYTGEIIMCNSYYVKFLYADTEFEALTPGDLIGRKCYDLMHSGRKKRCIFCPVENLIDSAGNPAPPFQWENYFEDRDVWLRATSRLIHWPDGRLAHMVMFFDISEEKRKTQEIQYIAYYDPLLKIPNAQKLFLSANENRGNGNYLVCLELLDFRKINDIYSRQSGDNLLEEMKKWLFYAFSSKNICYRISGPSLGVFFHGYTEEQVNQAAKRIWKRFCAPWDIMLDGGIQRIFTGISLGIIPCDTGFESYGDMMNTIERVLDISKKVRTIRTHNEEFAQRMKEKMRLEERLKEAVLFGMRGFCVCYQPIIESGSERWTGLEALCRWTDIQNGKIQSTVFIDIAEKIGLIDIIDEWVMSQAMQQVKQWGLHENDEFILDVNFSPTRLVGDSVCEKILGALERADYPPDKLSLEITESAEINFDLETIELLKKLKETGVHLALDDFGIGYATLSNLRYMPVSVLKTDKSFVSDIESDAYLQHIMKMIIDLARLTNIKVIAEGVENQSQSKLLKSIGVDMMQGYLYATALSSEEIEKSLHKFDWQKKSK